MQTAALTSPPTLDDLVADPALEKVWVNGPDQVFVAEGGVSRSVPMALTVMDIRDFENVHASRPDAATIALAGGVLGVQPSRYFAR